MTDQTTLVVSLKEIQNYSLQEWKKILLDNSFKDFNLDKTEFSSVLFEPPVYGTKFSGQKELVFLLLSSFNLGHLSEEEQLLFWNDTPEHSSSLSFSHGRRYDTVFNYITYPFELFKPNDVRIQDNLVNLLSFFNYARPSYFSISKGSDSFLHHFGKFCKNEKHYTSLVHFFELKDISNSAIQADFLNYFKVACDKREIMEMDYPNPKAHTFFNKKVYLTLKAIHEQNQLLTKFDNLPPPKGLKL